MMVLGVITAVSLGIFIWTNDIVIGYFNTGSPEAQGVVSVYSASSVDGSIQYGYGIELPTRFAGGMVEYDYQTVKGINDYVLFNQQQLNRLVQAGNESGNLMVRITFNQPLSQDDFIAFVEQYNLSVRSYIIWIENKDGTTTTIEGSPAPNDDASSATELVPAETLKRVIEDVRLRGGEESYHWVEVDGNLSLENAQEVAKDSRVFLVDVMESVIQEQFTDTVMKQAGIATEVRQAVLDEGFAMSRPIYLAWAIRNLGLMKGLVEP